MSPYLIWSRKVGEGLISNYVLAHLDSSSPWVESKGGSITSNGVVVNTSQKKFGAGSAFSNTQGNYLRIGTNSPITFGTGDWTIDFWYKFVSASTGWPSSLFYMYDSQNGNAPAMRTYTHDQNASTMMVGFQDYQTTFTTFPATGRFGTGKPTSSFVHLALVSYNGMLQWYLDGEVKTSWANTGVPTFDTIDFFFNPTLTTFPETWNWSGFYIDEFRIANGAVWTENFTPPTAAY